MHSVSSSTSYCLRKRVPAPKPKRRKGAARSGGGFLGHGEAPASAMFRWACILGVAVASAESQHPFRERPLSFEPPHPLTSSSAWIVSGVNYFYVISTWCNSYDEELSNRTADCLAPLGELTLDMLMTNGEDASLFCASNCSEVSWKPPQAPRAKLAAGQ